MTTLITGAAGYIGRNLLDAIIDRDLPARALVRDESQAVNLRERGVQVFVGDIRDAAIVREAVKGVTVVHHCAAAVGSQYSDSEIHEICLEGTRNVLEALREQGTGRVNIVSSINVLGNRNLTGECEDLPLRRFREIRGDVKIDIEVLARGYHREHGVDMVILRPPMIYGRGDHNLEKLLSSIRRGKFVFIGSRENVIPLVHVDDVVQALLLAADSPQASGRVYHITDGAAITSGELADYLAELTNSRPPQKVLPYAIPRVAMSLFELLKRVRMLKKNAPINRVSLRFLGTSRNIDISRARRELGYQPQVEFHQGMAAAIRWLENHADNETRIAATST